MANIATNDIRGGAKVEVDGQPYVVVSNEYVKPGKGQAFNRIRLRNLLNNRVIERTFKSGDKLELADVHETSMRMLYKEAHGAVFMNDDTFEQVTISFTSCGENEKWLLEDTLYGIVFYKGQAITIDPPTFMELKVVDTAPGVRGDTASGRVMKPATLETGAQVQIPIFIEQDEVVKIDTRTGTYVSRV